jgi:hypothetical protein
MAKKPMKSMEEMDDMDESEDESESEDEGKKLEVEISLYGKKPSAKKPKGGVVKKAKGGMIKNYSKIARPQRFSGIF